MEENCVSKKAITINCTWNVDSGSHDLTNTVKFSTQKGWSLEDLVQIETCVHVSCNNPTVPCSIYVKLDKTSEYVITSFSAVSEARIIECFGNLGEYNSTIHSEYMDDFEGCAVYSTSSDLPPSGEVTLKFARMKHENEMWLYGLVFAVKHLTTPEAKVAGINLTNVNQILKESSRPLSEKAESCKKFLQQCGSSPGVKVPDPQVLLKMFEGEYLKPLGETSKNMSKCITNILPFLTNKPDDSSVVNRSSESELQCASPSSSSSNNNIELTDTMVYMDRRFNELELKLTNKIEKRIQELEIAQHEKLDKIIKLLENK